ncbi:MAG: hypothetical protein Q8O89_02855 [Nanoarchaeota archaeon]|nr:hypothetical protein [Nanoarchaeota archaeon]
MKKIAILKKLLREWKLILGHYIEISQEDLPYWYNERVNTGFLAVAAWKLGGIAIEEYSVKRHHGKRKSQGRCDLWFKIDNLDFSIECKQVWPSIFSDKAAKNIKRALKDASKQLSKMSRKDKGSVNVSCCFVVPQINKTKFGKKDFLSFSRYFKDRNTLIDSYFPRVNNKNIARYPGIAIILRFNPRHKK